MSAAYKRVSEKVNANVEEKEDEQPSPILHASSLRSSLFESPNTIALMYCRGNAANRQTLRPRIPGALQNVANAAPMCLELEIGDLYAVP